MSTLAVNRHTPVNATAGLVAMTLPAGANSGDMIVVEKYDSTPHLVTVTGSVRGVPSTTINLSLPHQVMGFKADSAGSWWPIWGNIPLEDLSLNSLSVHVLDAPSGGSDDTVWNNTIAAISSAGGGSIGFRGQHHINNGSLILPSNIDVLGLDSTAELVFGWADSTTIPGAYIRSSDFGVTLAGGITSGSNAFVATTAVLTSNMVGRLINIAGAGYAAGKGLTAYITAVADATHCTLDRNAGQTVAAATTSVAGSNAGIRLRAFKVTGAGNGLPSGPNALLPVAGVPAGFALRYVAGLRIEGVEITKIPGIACSYASSSDVQIIGNRVHDSGRDGFTAQTLVGPPHDVVIANNVIRQVGDDGIQFGFSGGVGTSPDNTFARPRKVTITGNEIIGDQTQANNSLGRGIVTFGVEEFTIEGNTISDSASSGIYVRDTGTSNGFDPSTGANWRGRKGTVVGNTVIRAGQNTQYRSGPVSAAIGNQYAIGIQVLNCDDVLATPNTVYDSYQADFWQSGCTNVRMDKQQGRYSDNSQRDPDQIAAAAVATANVTNLTTATTAIDGYTLQAGDFVLLTGQSTASQNGLWQVPPADVTGSPSLGPNWFRPHHFNTGLGFYARIVQVLNGTLWAGTRWSCWNTSRMIVDTSSQTWQSMGPADQISTLTTFTANGTYTVPNGVSLIRVRLHGGGGGSGGSGASSIGTTGAGGGGGGAGQYIDKFIPVVGGKTAAVTIGAGGTPGTAGVVGGANGGAGGTGGDSVFNYNSGATILTAKGGGGGAGGGTASTAVVNGGVWGAAYTLSSNGVPGAGTTSPSGSTGTGASRAVSAVGAGGTGGCGGNAPNGAAGGNGGGAGALAGLGGASGANAASGLNGGVGTDAAANSASGAGAPGGTGNGTATAGQVGNTGGSGYCEVYVIR